VSDVPDTITVLVVDDHPMVRDGLAAVLRDEPDLEVVAVASDVAGAREEIERHRPDVVITDYLLPDGTGLDVARFATGAHGSKVLLISAVTDGSVIAGAVQAGCSGFVHKGLETPELAEAVRSAADGGAVFPASALRRLVREEQPRVGTDLTEREREVLRLLAHPMTATEIAEELHISFHTARNHVRAVLGKLHARSQLEAIVIAVRHGLIDLGET
jgi:DNA-binding NarL/FixJ family response regulator